MRTGEEIVAVPNFDGKTFENDKEGLTGGKMSLLT